MEIKKNAHYNEINCFIQYIRMILYLENYIGSET